MNLVVGDEVSIFRNNSVVKLTSYTLESISLDQEFSSETVF